MAKILIIGCGALGTALAENLAIQGHRVTGLKRNPPLSHNTPLQYVKADITLAADLADLESDFDYLFFIVSADSRDPNSYKSIYETGIDNIITHCDKTGLTAPWFFISSTSVYGQNQGEWVDEESPAAPTRLTSQLILAAENKVKQLNPDNVIVRFSGIYGSGREYLLRTAQQQPEIQQDPPYYTNRIHQEDCVNVLRFLLDQRITGIKLEPCYLASDNNPATLWEVMTWLAATMGYPPPLPKTLPNNQTHDLNKRCNNKKLRDLGYQFTYPDFKAGYSKLIISFMKHNNPH